MTEVTIGIDISKDRLDVHRLPDGETAAFGKDKLLVLANALLRDQRKWTPAPA